MFGGDTSQIIEKLAFIRRKAYLTYDFGGVDYRHRGYLKATGFSRSAGKNSAKPLLQRLTTPFGKAVGGAMLAGTMLASPVMAKDAPETSAVASQPVSGQSGIVFYDDADRKASEWAVKDRNNVAVSIRLGGATTFAPEDIERVLKHDFTKNGVPQAVFYWEHGGPTSGTSVAVETDDAVFGVFTLGEIREKIPEISKRIKFNQGIGFQASLDLDSQ